MIVYIATEDVISEAVAIKLLKEVNSNIKISNSFGKQGNGYLRSKVQTFCSISKREHFFLITDLDKNICPMALINSWTGNITIPKKLIFRVVVKEIESWLLADHAGISELLGQRAATKLPENPDSLTDPKSTLFKLAEKAPREIRDDLIKSNGVIISKGIGYNSRLINFVENNWDVSRAATRSQSLNKAILRLKEGLR